MESETETWVFRVQSSEGESFGHFMRRFRRANALSHQALALASGDSHGMGARLGIALASLQSNPSSCNNAIGDKNYAAQCDRQ